MSLAEKKPTSKHRPNKKLKKQARKTLQAERNNRGPRRLLGKLVIDVLVSDSQEPRTLKRNLEIQFENAQRWQALSKQCINNKRYREAEILQEKANKALAACQRGELVFDDY